jgi:hypothetical protein
LKQNFTPEIFEYTIPYAELDLSAEKIIRYIRSGNNSLDEFSLGFLKEFLSEAVYSSEIRGGFAIIPEKYFIASGSGLLINGTEFLAEKIITSRLRKADSAALFTATAGKYFEEQSGKMLKEGDVFSAFLIDSAGSEAAEAAAEWIQNRIEQYAASKALKITSRYSPGYCGWSVGEQHKLFSFFPDGFCGIRLTESALMTPVKSVSGIIGIGAEVRKEEYQCEICTDENCFRRNIL